MKTSTLRSGIFSSFVLIGTLAACTFPVTTGTATSTQTANSGQGKGAALTSALGVSETTLQKCMPRPTERPAAGTQPTKPDASIIATCLQVENPSLTTSAVEAALASNAPQQQQRPQR